MSELTLATFERVHKMVKRFLNPSFDTENLAMEVVLESWTNDHPEPSWSFVRNRCYDLLRRSQKEKEIMALPRPETTSKELDPGMKDQVNQLMKILNNEERKLIFFRYYLDLTLREIAERQAMPINKVREVLTSAVYKMRDASQE